MRKIQKILTGTLLGGVLLGGIGTGVALVEYSSFAYAGEKTIGEENLVTREIDFKFEPEKGKVVVVRGYWDRNYPNALEEDETVPEGVVRYVVTHNSKITDVELSFETYSQEEMEEVEEMEGVAVSECSKNKEAAWEFVKFLTSPEVAKYYTNTFTGTGDPAVAFEEVDNAIVQPNADALAYAKALPSVGCIVGIRQAIFDDLSLTLTDSRTVEEAVQQLNEDVNQLLAGD